MHNSCISYLHKHLANWGACFVRSTVHRHRLPVSGKFQGKLFLHQLLDHLNMQQNPTTNKNFSNKVKSCTFLHNDRRKSRLKAFNYIQNCRRWLAQPWRGLSRLYQTRSSSQPGMWEPSLWPHPPSRTHLWPGKKKKQPMLMFYVEIATQNM